MRWYCYQMPFGISPIFQQKPDHNLEGLAGSYKTADDILITGRSETLDEANHNHDMKLHQLLQQCREWYIKLNFHKLKFMSLEVAYLYMGHALSSDRFKVTPKRQALLRTCQNQKMWQKYILLAWQSTLLNFYPLHLSSVSLYTSLLTKTLPGIGLRTWQGIHCH